MVNITRLMIIKCAEVIITCICVGIHANSYNLEADVGMLVTGTFVGFLIIFVGAAAGHVLKTPAHKHIDMFYSIVGAALFIASGGVLIDRFQNFVNSDYRNKNLAKASLAIINGAVLLVDAVLTHRGG